MLSHLRMRTVAWTFTCVAVNAMVAGAPPSPDRNPTYLPRPYTIDVNQSSIDDIRQKASSFHPSAPIREPVAWADGPPSSKVVSLARYWLEEYNWAAVQSRINAEFDHYITTVPSPGEDYPSTLDIHFIHQQSSRDDAIPMLMLHGWPSTSLEWEKVIPDLVEPKDSSNPAFHIVAPDLPGYGFSPAPTAPLAPSDYATVFATLMQQLGYGRYAVYSTDLGFVIGRSMVAEHGTHIINHVTDLYLAQASTTDMARYAANETTQEETSYIASNNVFLTMYGAYSALHSTLPLSVAYALDDSPVGFLAWVYQLVYTVSDNSYSPSELITQALLLYLPGVYSNIRSYKELFPALIPLTAYQAEKPGVPTSVLQFGGITSYPGMQALNYVVIGIIQSNGWLTD